jgi:hypothetical protein
LRPSIGAEAGGALWALSTIYSTITSAAPSNRGIFNSLLARTGTTGAERQVTPSIAIGRKSIIIVA